MVSSSPEPSPLRASVRSFAASAASEEVDDSLPHAPTPTASDATVAPPITASSRTRRFENLKVLVLSLSMVSRKASPRIGEMAARGLLRHAIGP
jgi:hypothetical protein